MVIFDTNTIIRYILHDNEQMANLVEKKLSEKFCLLTIEVVA